jgi:hypothetical protein
MKKVLERVAHLIASAANPSSTEEEARTAAVQACRLIHKHGLILLEPGDVTEATEIPKAAKSRPRRPSAHVRVPLRAVAGLEQIGRTVQGVALEAASRVTIADVVDVVGVFVKRRR